MKPATLLLQTSQTLSGIVKMLKRQGVLTFSLCKSCIEHLKVNVDRDSSRCIPLLYCIERESEVGKRVVKKTKTQNKVDFSWGQGETN